MANVIIKRHTASLNIDTYNRSCVHDADLPNGAVFSLTEKSANGQILDWKVAYPVVGATLWMATSPEVIYVDKGVGGSADPRDFVNKAGRQIDAIRLAESDLIEMTGDGITGFSTANFLVPATDGYILTAATQAPTTAGSIYLAKVGVNTLKIGNGGIAPADIPTHYFEVKKV